MKGITIPLTIVIDSPTGGSRKRSQKKIGTVSMRMIAIGVNCCFERSS